MAPPPRGAGAAYEHTENRQKQKLSRPRPRRCGGDLLCRSIPASGAGVQAALAQNWTDCRARVLGKPGLAGVCSGPCCGRRVGVVVVQLHERYKWYQHGNWWACVDAHRVQPLDGHAPVRGLAPQREEKQLKKPRDSDHARSWRWGRCKRDQDCSRRGGRADYPNTDAGQIHSAGTRQCRACPTETRGTSALRACVPI